MNTSVLHLVLIGERSCVDVSAQATSSACTCRIHLDDVGEGVQ
jgi:hypothetical protein